MSIPMNMANSSDMETGHMLVSDAWTMGYMLVGKKTTNRLLKETCDILAGEWACHCHILAGEWACHILAGE